MATIDGTGRPGYMYDEATDVWFEISGKVSTAANYQWLGAHQFDNNVTNNGAITAKLKFNSFLNPAARLSAIPSPGTGLISFIQQDAIGNTINKFQYWNGSAWADISSVSYSSSAPSSPSAGNIWVDLDDDNLYVYNGSTWALLSTAYSATAPSNPINGNVWIKSTDNSIYVYDGTNWVQAGGGGGKSFSMLLGGM
jgi:hypothetical protein